MQTTVSISTAQVYLINTDQVDASGTELKVQDASYSVPSFASSDETIATVNSSGVVTPVGLGTCTITATETSDGKPTITGTLVVTVTSPQAASLDLTGTITTGS